MEKLILRKFLKFLRLGMAFFTSTLTPTFPGTSFARSNQLNESELASYSVKSGDTLSDVLYCLSIFPLYGPHSTVQRTIAINRRLFNRQDGFIKPGNVILLPVKELPTEVSADCSGAQRKVASVSKTEDEPAVTSAVTVPISAVAVEPADVHDTATSAFPDASVSTTDEEAHIIAAIAAARAADETKISAPATAANDETFEPYSKIEVDGGATYHLLQGTERTNQTTGRFISTLSPTMRVAWHQHWAKEVSTRLFVDLESIHFLAERSGRTINNSAVFNTGFGIGMSREWNDVVALSLDLQFAPTLFYQAASANTLEINQVPLFALHPSLSSRLIRRRPFSLWGTVSASYLSPAEYDSYSIESGSAYSVGLKIDQEFKENHLECGIDYSERRQSTSILEVLQKFIGVRCGFKWGPIK